MKIFKRINLVFIITIIFLLSSCSSSNTDSQSKIYNEYFSNYKKQDNTSSFIEIKSSDTKLYYAENKYVSFSASSDFIVTFKENDIVLFDDGTAMAKLYSIVNLSLSNSNFKLIHNNNYVNYKDKKILSKISTGSKSYSLCDIDLSNFKIVNTSLISCSYDSFDFIGNMIYFPNDKIDLDFNLIDFKLSNSEITSSTGKIFYAYISDNFNFENITNSNIISNIEYTYKINQTLDNTKSLHFEFDCVTENETFLDNRCRW